MRSFGAGLIDKGKYLIWRWVNRIGIRVVDGRMVYSGCGVHWNHVVGSLGNGLYFQKKDRAYSFYTLFIIRNGGGTAICIKNARDILRWKRHLLCR